MVTAHDLLNLAESLATDPREIAHRSAASRAYYAAFWRCRDVVADRFGPVDTVGADVHRAVADAVRFWDEAVAELIQLRVVRNRADYEPGMPFEQRIAERSVARARRILVAD